MRKITIEELKKRQPIKTQWTKEEIEFLKECIEAGIRVKTLVMENVFPNFTAHQVSTKYYKLREGGVVKNDSKS